MSQEQAQQTQAPGQQGQNIIFAEVYLPARPIVGRPVFKFQFQLALPHCDADQAADRSPFVEFLRENGFEPVCDEEGFSQKWLSPLMSAADVGKLFVQLSQNPDQGNDDCVWPDVH
jgi:hypothetical protein